MCNFVRCGHQTPWTTSAFSSRVQFRSVGHGRKEVTPEFTRISGLYGIMENKMETVIVYGFYRYYISKNWDAHIAGLEERFRQM